MDTREFIFFLKPQIFCYGNTVCFNKKHFNISLIKKKNNKTGSEHKHRNSTYPYIFCQAKAILYPYTSTDAFFSVDFILKISNYFSCKNHYQLRKKVLCFDKQSKIFYLLKESVICKEHIWPTSAAAMQRNSE